MIVYASRTGNVKNVCSKLEGIECVSISDVINLGENFFIFTYTDGLGEVPQHVEEFLRSNNNFFLKGVIASGNTNFGTKYCLSADKISRKYNVPIVAKIELRGTKKDIIKITKSYDEIIRREG